MCRGPGHPRNSWIQQVGDGTASGMVQGSQSWSFRDVTTRFDDDDDDDDDDGDSGGGIVVGDDDDDDEITQTSRARHYSTLNI